MTPPPEPTESRPDLRLDLDRRSRLGMVEAIWGEHKSAGQIVAALEGMHQAGQVGLVTRVVASKAEAVLAGLAAKRHDPTTWRYHPDGRCICSAPLPQADPERRAKPAWPWPATGSPAIWCWMWAWQGCIACSASWIASGGLRCSLPVPVWRAPCPPCWPACCPNR